MTSDSHHAAKPPGWADRQLERAGRIIAQRHRLVIMLSLTFCLALGSYALLIAPFALQTVTLAPDGSIVQVYSDIYEASSSGSFVDPTTIQERQTIPFGTIVLLYVPKDGQADYVLGPGTDVIVSQMHAMESRIRALPEYKDRCLVDPKTGQCSEHVSITNFLYPSFYNGSTIPTFDGKGALQLESSSIVPLLEYGVDSLVSTDYTATHPIAKYARTFYQFGGPLDGYNNLYQDLTAQTSLRNDFLLNKVKPILLDYFPDWEVVYAGTALTNDEINTYVAYDAFFPIVSVFLVLAYMRYHMKSLLLAFLGMGTILSSFPIAYFLYRVLLDQRMNTLNFMSVFLILGIGADDVFILTDMWKQSGRAAIEHGLPVDFENRMVWTFTRSIKTMFVTTFTTATSFLASGISIIPAIQSFGYFAAAMVLANYFQVATFFFACVCWFDRRQLAEMFRRYYDDRHRAAKRMQDKQAAASAGGASDAAGSVSGGGSSTAAAAAAAASPAPAPGSSDAAIFAAAASAAVAAEANSLTRPRAGTGASTRSRNASLASSRATSVAQVDEEMEAQAEVQRIKAAQRAGILSYNAFMTEDRNGMQKFLSGPYARFLDRHAGKVILFFIGIMLVSGIYAMQLENTASERSLLPDFTHLTRFTKINGNNFKADERSDSVQINFFWGLQDLDRSVADKDNPDDVGRVIYDDRFDLDTNQDLFIQLCQDTKDLVAWVDPDTEKCLMRNYRQWLNATQAQPASLVTGLKAFVSQSDYDGYSFSDHVGFNADSSRILWASYTFTSTLPPNQNATTVRPHFNFWENWVAEQNAVLPTSFQMKHTSTQWVDMVINESLSGTAISGMLISGLIAFIVLFGTNRNIILTTYAFISIVGIVLSLMAALVGLGYGLGAMESIILTTSVGLSVDYVVHLAEAYKISEFKTRRARAIDALEHIGPSIIGGAVTTMLAASMLFIAFISWSAALGQMIFLNIILSLVYSMCFFVAVLIVAGPVGPMCGPSRPQGGDPEAHDDAASSHASDAEDLKLNDTAAFDANWDDEQDFDPNHFTSVHRRVPFLTTGNAWHDASAKPGAEDASAAFRPISDAAPPSIVVSCDAEALHTPRGLDPDDARDGASPRSTASSLASAASSSVSSSPPLPLPGPASSMTSTPRRGLLSGSPQLSGDPGSRFSSPRSMHDSGDSKRSYKNDKGETVIILPGYE